MYVRIPLKNNRQPAAFTSFQVSFEPGFAPRCRNIWLSNGGAEIGFLRATPVEGKRICCKEVPVVELRLRSISSGCSRSGAKMKTCPVCELELEDTYLYCPDDGSSLGFQAKGNIDSEVESLQSTIDRRSEGDVVAEAPRGADEPSADRPGFRIAAVATVIALLVFSVLSLYGLVKHLTRRPAPPVAQVASPKNVDAQPLPFIATPEEARDYKELQPAPEASAPSESQTDSLTGRNHSESISPVSAGQNVRKTTIGQASPKQPLLAARPQPERLTISPPQAQALPRGNSGGFDSRLVRARGTRTSSGYRYDLTFNMLEQAGRSAQWQRVLISARSASGANHTTAIPFVHRLGAAGALTFTISVELTGRSETDWRGRVVCTALGWDNGGAPVQSSFGASVTP
jgi:hypothetical protein